jgi:hypothetical protein
VPDRRRPGKNTLPDQRTLLTWLFVGRLVLATGVLLWAGLVWTERPQESFIVSVAVVFALVFTGYGVGTVFLLRRKPGNAFFLVQALVDLALVTMVVHFAGQPKSAFPALYVLVVAGYALLMPPAWAAVTAVLASLLYLGDTIWNHGASLDTASWAQIGVYNLVFALVAVLGHRLREAGMEQATLATAGGRRHSAEHPVRRSHGRRIRTAGVHQSDGGTPARPRRRSADRSSGSRPAEDPILRTLGRGGRGNTERTEDQPG